MRGELKTTARAAVEAEFGFIAREAKTIANKRLYERLVHDNLFLYEVSFIRLFNISFA